MRLRKILSLSFVLICILATSLDARATVTQTETTQSSTEQVTTEATTEVTAQGSTEEKVGLGGLKKKVNKVLKGKSGTWSVYVKNLDTNEYMLINDKKLPSASLIKLYVMMAAYERVDEGELDEDKALTSSMKKMITVSDNASANSITKSLSDKKTFDSGKKIVNTYCNKNGYSKTAFKVEMGKSSPKNVTSARDCGLALERMYRGEAVSKSASKKMIKLLKAQTRRSKIPAGVPDGVTVANKTGETTFAENDAAIVYSEGANYVIVVMAKNSKNGVSTIKKISETVYQHFNPEEKKTTKSGNGKKVYIDPGHQSRANGGLEPVGPGSSIKKPKVSGGCTGVYTKIPEYKFTLTIAKKLKAALIEEGYEVEMSRTKNDVNISNVERAKKGNESGADICIRIHSDSINDSSVRGVSVLYPSTSNPYPIKKQAKKSKKLAQNLLDEYCKATKIKSRGIVVRNDLSGTNWSTIPTVLIECGFFSNPEEDKLLNDDKMQEKMVNGMVSGINKYFGF
ncbi:MAG: hypothetical protein E7271_09060 [Lachnospiraceae bacterium]|nr:hypothetical protein [Lachnospiraceae bacterium]